MKVGAFISYSHEDALYITPIVKLIQAMRKDLVFQDSMNIKPGKLWNPQLLQALHQARVIIVFWCKHAAKSAFVKKEYKAAIKENKMILPLLLDDTKLVRALSAYQWIDFRVTNIHIKTPTAPVISKIKYHRDQYIALRRSAPGTTGFAGAISAAGYGEIQKYLHLDKLNKQYKKNTKAIASGIFNKLNEIMPP